MKNNRGFTLLEVAIVTLILVIMAGFAVVKYQKTAAQNQLEKAANNLYIEMRGLRALAYRYDGRVQARFNPAAAQCTIWVDTSDDESLKMMRIRIYQIPPPVIIGRSPTGGTYSSPYSSDPNYLDWRTPHENCTYSNGTEGSWRYDERLDVFRTADAQYEGGGVYLHNPHLKRTTYFIGIAWQRSQSVELKKWNGYAWDNL